MSMEEKKQKTIEILESINDPQIINNLFSLVNEYKEYYS